MDTHATAPMRFLPWRHTLVSVATGAVVTIPAFALDGAGTALGSSAGLVIGSFAAMASGLRRAAIVSAITALAVAAVLAVSQVWLIVTLSLVFAALASVETVHWGTRAFVMALFAFLMAMVGLGYGASWPLLVFFILGAMAGMASVHWLQSTRALPKMPRPPAGALALGLFLTIGLAIAFALIAVLDEPRGYWIALLFISRAIVPYEAQRPSALRFGKGASIGVVFALAIEALALPAALQLAIAGVAGLAGIRCLPHPLPIASACFSAAILLSTATTFGEAVFRMEAIVIVVLLVLFLSFGIDRLWAWLRARFPEQATSLT